MPNYRYNERQENQRRKLKDKKLSVYEYATTLDDEGVAQEGYVALAADAWAYVRQIGGGLYFSAASSGVDLDVQFFVNWNSEIAKAKPTALCVVYNERVYKVTRIDTYEDYKRDICLYCKYDEHTSVASVTG